MFRTKNGQKSLLEFLTGDSRYKKITFGAVDKLSQIYNMSMMAHDDRQFRGSMGVCICIQLVRLI